MRRSSRVGLITGNILGVAGVLTLCAAALLFNREWTFISGVEPVRGTIGFIECESDPNDGRIYFVPRFYVSVGETVCGYPGRKDKSINPLAYHQGDAVMLIYGSDGGMELDGFWPRWCLTLATGLSGLAAIAFGLCLARIPARPCRPPIPGRSVRRLIRQALEQDAELVVERP